MGDMRRKHILALGALTVLALFVLSKGLSSSSSSSLNSASASDRELSKRSSHDFSLHGDTSHTKETQGEGNVQSPEVVSGPPLFMVILVLTSRGGLERRNAMRETWLADLPASVDFRFVVGGLGCSNSTSACKALYKEEEEYGDLAILPDTADTYGTLTLKLRDALVYFERTFPRFKFLLKVDDDTFVRLAPLLDDLDKQDPTVLFNWGYFDGRAPVIRKGKWAEMEWILSDRYLPYSLGGGYVVSAPVVRFVAANARILKTYNSEDVSLGAWLSGLNMVRRHDVRFDTEWKSRGCQNKFLVTHKQSVDDMRRKHAQLLATDGKAMCAKETKVRGEYEYNWSVLPSQCCPGRGTN